jgi:hypothetical protein
MDRGRQTVKFYGLIYFQCKDGYLAASGLDGERLFLRTPSIVSDTADEALPFFGFADACVFRVVPTLSSRAAASSVKCASGAVSPQGQGGSDRGGGAAADERSEGSTASATSGLDDFQFDPRKTADIIDVEEITYGKSFSLVHEASGLFVSVAHALPSENDPDCLSVVLVKPSAAMNPSCELSLVSRYKIHADGDKLCRADSVLIRLAASPMFLHVSSAPIMETRGDNEGDIELLQRTFRFGSSLTYASKTHVGPGGVGGAVAAAASAAQGSCVGLQGSFAMPAEHAVAAPERCSTDIAAEALTREYLDEVNACEEGGVSFTLQRYDMGTDRANRQRAQLRITRPYVACGVPIALYHRERESFLTTSATQFAGPTEVEEEREFDRSKSTTFVPEDLNAVPGGATTVPQAHQALLEGTSEVDTEDGLAAPALRTRQRKSKLSRVAALGGAEAAAGASRKNSSGLPNNTHSKFNAAGSFNTALLEQQQQLQQRARALLTEGLVDTGRGRFFPFPVFSSSNPEGTVTSGDLSLLDANRSCTTLWCFEHEEPMLGGPLRYGSSWRYRIRHVVSGMYLAVCGSAVDAMLEDYNEEDSESAKGGARGGVEEAALLSTSMASSTVTTASLSADSDNDEKEEGDDVVDNDTTKKRAGSSETKGSGHASPRSSSAPPSDRTKATAKAKTSGTAATVMTALDVTATSLKTRPIRETSLCLIPQPRSRKEREATVFCVEPMYATDSVYLIEQTCLSIKNMLTEMYVVTDAGVDGSNVSLSLDWQPSPADPIIVSYVPHQLQLDTRFIAFQCVWLARYRAEMQALVLAHQKERMETVAAALRGDEAAKKRLAADEAYRQSLPEKIQPYFNTPDSDRELLKAHKGFMAARISTKKEWADNLSSTYNAAATANNWSISGRKGSGVSYNKGPSGIDAATAVPLRPSYVSMHNTIRLCQRSLIALIEFCSESDETNVLRREGLMNKSRQALFYEMRFHRLLFDVIMAPFKLLHSADPAMYGAYSSVVNSIAALMKSDYGSFDEIYETLRMAQQQQADLSCMWSGVWRSSASGNVAAATPCPGLVVSGEGLLNEKELMLPVHRELHLLTRLALRLLRQIIRNNAATFTAGWSAHIPKLLQLDGLRLHVVDTMQELFTDNPYIPLQAVQQVSEHFISVSQQLRRGAYMDFLGAACTIKYKGVPERQAFVCQKLLVENPQSLCRFVVVVPPGKKEAEGRVYILPSGVPDITTDSEKEDTGKARPSRTSSSSPIESASPFPPAFPQSLRGGRAVDGEDGVYAAPPFGFVPFTDFFSSATDKKQEIFVSNQIALFARLCYDGCPAQCREVVSRLFPPAAMKCLLRNFVWTGKQVVGHSCAHDKLRSFLIRLAMQCFVLPRISAPAVQLRVSTVLFGSSQLRQDACPTYSGLPDDEMTSLLKSVVMALLRANPFFVQYDTERSLLLRGTVSVWLKLTRYRQYTHEEVLTVLPMLMQLLDGTRDVLDANALYRANLDATTSSTGSAVGAGGGARSRVSDFGPRSAGSPRRFASPRPLAATTNLTASGGGGCNSRLVHSVESMHLMRIREMICQALFLALQHEVFRAADNVIVHLYKAYTQIDPGSFAHDRATGPGVLGALSAVAQMPSTAVKELAAGIEGQGSAAAFSEKSPLLGLHNIDVVTMPPAVDHETAKEAEAKKSFLAAQRHADGYRELPDDAPGSFMVNSSSARLRGSAMYSSSWTSQLIRTEASTTYAALSSSDNDNEEEEKELLKDGDGGVGQTHTTGSSGGVSAAEVQAALDYHTSCIVEYFQPNRLVPFLFDVARYDCRPLTVQAMALLVQLCVVKRSIAQLVLKVNTLPSYEVLRGFDRTYEVAVQLKEAYDNVVPGTPRATQWEPAIQFALDVLNGPHTPFPQEAESEAEPYLSDGGAGDAKAPSQHPEKNKGGKEDSSGSEPRQSAAKNAVLPPHHHHYHPGSRGSSIAAKREANFKRIYESFQGASTEDLLQRNSGDDDDADEEDEEESSEGEEEAAAEKTTGGDGGKTSQRPPQASEEAPLSTSMRLRRKKERISALWSKTSGAARMLVYSNTIRNRRRALGLAETSTIPVSVIIRAEMMAHWRIHEPLLQMLSYLTSADPLFKSVLQFFYSFTFSESNSLLLQPYVRLFVDKLDPADTSAMVCLHIIVRVLRSTPHVEDYLTPELLEAIASHINDELYTKLPDSELVEMLSQYIFSKSSVSPVARRRMMILFREHGTLMNLARFRLNPTPVEVVFTSALVNLVCNICGSHTSVLTLARSMLPAESICSVILQKRIVETLPTAIVDGSRSARVASQAADTSATPTAVAALKLLNPYVRVLVALYFIPKNDSQDDNRRRCLHWMGNTQLWSIVRLFTTAMEAVSNAIEQDGDKRVVNRGLNGVMVYRVLLCSTIPVALAGFLINCFSNEGFNRYQSEVIRHAFYELAAAAERFGALLLKYVAVVNLTVEEVVNYRRFLGILYHRLVELDSPSAIHVQDLAERCNTTRHQFRTWLSEQQRALQAALVEVEDAHTKESTAGSPELQADHHHHNSATTQFSFSGSAASFTRPRKAFQQPAAESATAAVAAYMRNVRRQQASTDDDISAFRLLFAEEAVSQAQLYSQEVLEAAGVGGADSAGPSRNCDSANCSREPEGADTNGLNSIGLLLPGVLARSRGVSAVRTSLRATLRGDTIIPSIHRCPSEVAMIATQHLLRSAHDAAMRESIKCVLEAMRDHLFRPRTFVGVLNLFSNALDTALHYPELVKGLCGAGMAGRSDSAVSAPQTVSPNRRPPPALAPKETEENDDGTGGSGKWNPDAAVSTESLGYALQTTFNDTGMLCVVISLCGLEEDVISLNAIRLGVLILEGGNRHAQSRLLDYFLSREEGFFHNVCDTLHKNLLWVENINAEHQYYLMKRGIRGEETKNAVAATNIQIINALVPQQNGGCLNAVDSNLEVFTASKSYVASLHGDHKKWLTTLSTASQVSGWARVRGSRRLKLVLFLFRLLQLFCEGHFAGLQNYVRSQHDNLHSANVIIETMAFMEELSVFVTPSNYRVLSQGFELLTEVSQGPCRLNQEALISYGVCRVIRHIVDYLQRQSGDDRRELAALLQKVSSGGGNSNKNGSSVQKTGGQGLENDVMNRLSEEEAAQLRLSISNTLLAVLEGCREAETYRRVLRQIPLTSVAIEVQYAFNPATMHLLQHNEEQFESDDRMEAMFNWLIYLKSVEPYAELEGVLEGVKTLLRSSEAVSRYLGSIEIKRADGLERVYFRIPLICRSLTQERKDELLWSVDRTSRATKLADFLHKSDEIIFAVEWNHAFHNRIAKWTRFSITYYDEETGERPGVLWRVMQSMKAFYNNYIATNLFPYELASYDRVSMVLAVLSNTILVAMEGGQTAVVSRVKLYADRVVSVLCILQTVVCGFMCLVYLTVLFPIHLYGVYKTKQRFAAGRVRMNVDLAEVYANLTMRERWHSFLSWFDMQFRIVLLLFAILSCTVSHYFAAFNLMLVVYSIPTLRTFISAITMNGKQLLLTSFMGVIMLYLFSIVGFLVFSNQYDPNGDDADPKSQKSHVNCESLLQCFAYILDQGLRAGGGVGDVMQPWAWGNSRMLARLTYDMLFYALVTVVFLNILFGIIIDTFGQMRDEKREKETDMHGFCFICGLDADTLEKGSVMGFANHVKQEHNMWMYLYFMHHLRRKDSSEYTGQESYVNACIKRSGLKFFPEENCVSLMEQREQEEAEQANAIGDDDAAAAAENNGGGGASGEAVDAAARVAMKELTVARETINAHLKEWQGDSMRMKALLQQLELTSRSIAVGGSNAGGGGGGGGGSLQRRGTMSVRSGQTLPRSAKAETLAASDAAAMEMQGSLAYTNSVSFNNRPNLSGGGSSGNGETPRLRAMQAQLQMERELRQRYEEERKTVKELLKAKEAEIKMLKKHSETKAAAGSV